ncbi:hypothetical protein W02_16180 [Nitrospira sp. KM1]|uniref:glycosyltransferase family protein n=1 Tax=Nitrospira sp. KM1 TaxID=1936990 RepID=UPI0013A78801|nr:glycosyltransferase [Nitrospira sp. KM1]BCA54478.1 hypothetical protein W02_16180 [Nitrospira sp. KM1]
MKALAVLPPDRWMEINLLDTLRRHYCEELHVFTYPGGMGELGSKRWRQQRDELNLSLIQYAKELKTLGKLDLMFFIVYDDFLLLDTARQLRDLNVPMVNYHVDMAFQWYRVIKTAGFFDVVAVAQLTNSEHLRPYNPNIEWLPMAANPQFYFRQPHGNGQGQCNVSFIGSFNPFRRALLAECVKRGIRPVVFGNGWKSVNPSPYRFSWDAHKILHDLRFYALARWKAEGCESLLGPLRRKYARRVSFQELEGADLRGPCDEASLPSILNQSHVNLGFSDTGWHSGKSVCHSHNLQCRLRDFEVPMAGGLYLVQEAPDHKEYFRLGEEIVTWSDPDEFIEKLQFYSRNEQAAYKVRVAGQKRVLKDHTWQQRFDQLFARLRTEGVMA